MLLEETMLSMNTGAEDNAHRRVSMDFFELPLSRFLHTGRALLWTMGITCPKNQTKALVLGVLKGLRVSCFVTKTFEKQIWL
jgi:hypothetical protein